MNAQYLYWSLLFNSPSATPSTPWKAPSRQEEIYVSITTASFSRQHPEDWLGKKRKTRRTQRESQQAWKRTGARISNQSLERCRRQRHWPHGALMKMTCINSSEPNLMQRARLLHWGLQPLCSNKHFNVVKALRSTDGQMGEGKSKSVKSRPQKTLIKEAKINSQSGI